MISALKRAQNHAQPRFRYTAILKIMHSFVFITLFFKKPCIASILLHHRNIRTKKLKSYRLMTDSFKN